MDTICIPDPLPITVTRPRPLIEAIMSQSLREQGPGSRTAAAWRWVLTGTGPSPVSQHTAIGSLPTPDEITAEASYGHDTDPPECGWPPWQYAHDDDPDRQQARRVLRWLTGAADAIPLLDPARGRFVGARFHFARTDVEIRRVRESALRGLREHGDLPDDMPPWQAEQPWQWPSWWMNAAWLRGTIAYLDWVLGDTPIAPLSRQYVPLDPVCSLAERDPRVVAALREMNGVGIGIPAVQQEMVDNLYAVIMQGRENQPPAEPTLYPPPQWGEAVEQAHAWVTGEDAKPPADHHGCGDYHPCPGLRRCSCEAAGYCLRGQCPACTDRICNAAWTAIQESY
jgi:hypothetical protein